MQQAQNAQRHNVAENTTWTEAAFQRAWFYLDDLAKQLNIITPAGPALSLDDKTPWPAMRLSGFRVDARKKMIRNQEVYDYIGLWWRILPVSGQPESGAVSVNFPPDLQRVESRLSLGHVQHERKETRDPEKNTLLAIRFLYTTESRGTVTLTADHDKGEMDCRIANARGFEAVNTTKLAKAVDTPMLDELAKLILGQTSRFI